VPRLFHLERCMDETDETAQTNGIVTGSYTF
jgi:hypothetical protein